MSQEDEEEYTDEDRWIERKELALNFSAGMTGGIVEVLYVTFFGPPIFDGQGEAHWVGKSLYFRLLGIGVGIVLAEILWGIPPLASFEYLFVGNLAGHLLADAISGIVSYWLMKKYDDDDDPPDGGMGA